MLWMKSWLEIRWRLLLAFVIILTPLGVHYVQGTSAPAAVERIMSAVAMMWLMVAATLGGSGIQTQAPIQASKGLHGSTHFTLSLPVSRFRLLAVRVGMSLVGLIGVVFASTAAAWVFFPLVRADSTALDLLMWAFTAGCCAIAINAISVLLSTAVDEVWQVWGTVIVVVLLRTLTIWFPPPAEFDVFRVVMKATPLATGAIPWPAICVSLGLAGILYFTAVKVAEAREY